MSAQQCVIYLMNNINPSGCYTRRPSVVLTCVGCNKKDIQTQLMYKKCCQNILNKFTLTYQQIYIYDKSNMFHKKFTCNIILFLSKSKRLTTAVNQIEKMVGLISALQQLFNNTNFKFSNYT